MSRRHFVLPDAVSFEQIDAVEIGQEVSLEESPDRLVDPLVRRLDAERAVRSGATLEADGESAARRGLGAVVDRGDERQRGADGGVGLRDTIETAIEHGRITIE